MRNLSQSILEGVINLEVPRELADDDKMYAEDRRHYFSVGRSALINVMAALTCRLNYHGGEAPIGSILDYGCGHGRVARYLRAAFPDARTEVTDINKGGVEWCVSNLGCMDMGARIPENSYDLVWVGSVLTHLPAASATELLQALKLSLKQNGILIFTTHGRFCIENLEAFLRGETEGRYISYGISKELAAGITSDYYQSGYGYRPYPSSHDYGLSMGTPSWFGSRVLAGRGSTLQLLCQERGWDTHQDVLAFMCAPNAKRGRYFF